MEAVGAHRRHAMPAYFQCLSRQRLDAFYPDSCHAQALETTAAKRPEAAVAAGRTLLNLRVRDAEGGLLGRTLLTLVSNKARPVDAHHCGRHFCLVSAAHMYKYKYIYIYRRIFKIATPNAGCWGAHCVTLVCN